MDPRPDLEILLRHDRRLRALARGLLADASRADDVVQQTWVEALTSAPRAPVFAWLAAVARRLAWRARREDRRRARREQAAARSEATPSDGEIRARESSRHAVVEAVLALEEPYKTTVVLRFLEGLPPRAVARRMQVPVETVRTRARRALELLRARLDRDHGGDRLAWSVPLAHAAHGAAVVPFLAGVLVMTTKTKLIAAGLGAAALSLALWLASGPGPGAPVSGASLAAAADPAAAASRPEPAPLREVVAVPAPSRPASGPAATGSLLVNARWADGTPAADVGIGVLVLAEDPGLPADELVARSDAAGQALFESLAPGRVRACLDRGDERGVKIAAGQRSEVVLQPGRGGGGPNRPRRVDGQVVDDRGTPVAGAEVRATRAGSPLLGCGLVAAHSAVDGTFSLRDVAVPALLEARAPGWARSRLDAELSTRLIRNDETPEVRVKLVLPGKAGTVRGTVRDAGGGPVAGALVQVGPDNPGVVTNAGGPPRPERVRTDREGRFVCECAPLGTVPVCVRARGRGVWTGSVEVAAGREPEVAAELRPGVTVRGAVRDDEGQPVKEADVRVGRYGQLASTGASTTDTGAYELAGLAGGDVEILVQSRELGTAAARVTARPGSALTQDFVLGGGITLRGRVVGEDGKPIVASVDASARGPRPMTRSVATDAEGRFRIKGWAEVPTSLAVMPRLFSSGPTLARVAGVLPSQGEVTITVRAADVPSAFLIGILLGPDGKPCAGTRIYAKRADASGSGGGGETGLDAATGAFRIGPLTSGTWKIVVDSHERGMLGVGPHRLEAGQTLDLGTVRMQEPGTVEIQATRADGRPSGEGAWSLFDAQDHFMEGIMVVNGVLKTVLAPGRYRFVAYDQGIAEQRVEIDVRSGQPTKLEVTLRPGVRVAITFTAPREARRVRLRIVGASGEPVVDATLFSYDKDGAFETTRSLVTGTYRAEAEADTGAKASFPITVEAGKAPAPLAIELR